MPDPPSTPEVAAVAGRIGGIGPGIVIALTQRDFDVVVCDRTIDPAIAERMTPSAALGVRLSFIRIDLADPADLPRFVDAIFAAFGHIECLVNNAGVSAKSRGDLLDISAESHDLNFSVNTRSAFFLTQAVCKMLAAEGDFPEGARSVVFISSSNAVIAGPERGQYAMSKVAVAMMTKLFAIRLAPNGIRTRGPARSDSHARTGVAQSRFDRLLVEGFTPINRWCTPEDVGRAVATVAAGELPFTTGAAIQGDGGMHIHQY
jgi:NAD(P)-dependent dehydrogenase (short-subunit alcohol dehydrogenase family)